MIQKEFERGAAVPVVLFPEDGAAVQDTPRLMLVVMDPSNEWTGDGVLRRQIAEWTKQRGKTPRLYPASLVWCLKKPGRDLRENVETWLAWRRVAKEVADGTLGGDFDRTERTDIQSKVSGAEDAAEDEVWASYRFAAIYDGREPDGLKIIDLGAGHASSGETLCGRVITALKSQALLSESVGAGYIDRNWPPALKDSGAWPLTSLRQSFLNGSLTRLLDPDATLRGRILEFVAKGDFGLASGQKPDGTYERVWFGETVTADEVTFEAGVFLLAKGKAQALKAGGKPEPTSGPIPEPGPQPPTGPAPEPPPDGTKGPQPRTLRLVGTVPPELWNRLGTRILPKLRTGSELQIGVDFSLTLDSDLAQSLEPELRLILQDLGLADKIQIEDAEKTD